MREVFKIQNTTEEDIHLRDFGFIIPPNQTVELASFDKAVLSEELNDLLNDGKLVRLINNQPVTLTEIYMSTIQVQGVDSSLIAGQINDLHNYDVAQDASINILIDKNLSQDASIDDLNTWNFSQDVSLSLRPLTTYVDGSLNLKVNKAGDTMTGSLSISGADLIVGNDTSITRNLSVGNDVTVDNNLNVKNDTSIGKDLNVGNDATVDNNLTIANDASIGKDLSVKNNATIKNNLTIVNDTSIGKDLNVGNDATVDNNLNVKNDTSVGKDLSVENNATVKNNLDVRNDASIIRNLVIGNNTIVGNDLNVNNDASVIGNISIHDQTYLKGILPTQPDDITFGTPSAYPLPTLSQTYNVISKFGSGGPNVNNMTEGAITWNLNTNTLTSFSISQNVAPYWVNLTTISAQNFNQANPSVKIEGSGVPGLDGTYWVTTVGSDFVMVADSGNYSLYFSNATGDYIPPQYDENYILVNPADKKVVDSNLNYILFGREFNRAESPNQQTTTQRSYQTALSYTLPNVPRGRYRIGVNFRHTLSSKNDNFYGRVTIDNVQIGTPLTARQEIANHLYHSRTIYEVLEGSPTIAVQYYGSSGTAYISDIVLEIWRVE